MDPSVLVAMIVGGTAMASGFGSFISASVTAHRTKADRREERAADWARQDEVAAKAAETAALLLKTQKDGIRRTEEVARVAAIATHETHSQLRQIHAFVNSDLTKVLEADLDQTRITLVVLRKLVEGKDYRPTAEDANLIKTTESRINELEIILSRRPGQLLEVENEIRDARDARDARDTKDARDTA